MIAGVLVEKLFCVTVLGVGVANEFVVLDVIVELVVVFGVVVSVFILVFVLVLSPETVKVAVFEQTGEQWLISPTQCFQVCVKLPEFFAVHCIEPPDPLICIFPQLSIPVFVSDGYVEALPEIVKVIFSPFLTVVGFAESEISL